MSQALNDEIMGKLGDREIGELATALGTSPEQAMDTVRGSAVPTMVEEVEAAEPPEAEGPPLTGVALVAGGMLGGVAIEKLLRRKLDPMAAKISQKTGIPHAQVRSALAVLTPIVVGVVSRQMKKRSPVKGEVHRDGT
jgi:hypothetical protein